MILRGALQGVGHPRGMEEPSTIHPQPLVQSMYELRLELRRRLKHFIGENWKRKEWPDIHYRRREDVTFFWCSSWTAANAATFHVAAQSTLVRSGTAPKESLVRRFGRDDLDERTTQDYHATGLARALICSWWASLDFMG
jgi:hypothetical protein